MEASQNAPFEPYIPKKLEKFLKAYKPKEGITLHDIFDDVLAVMQEFETQRSKARGQYSFHAVYCEDLNKFLRLIKGKYPNAE